MADTKPQITTVVVNENAPNTFTVSKGHPTGVDNSVSGNKSRVMEILKLFWFCSVSDGADTQIMQLTTQELGNIDLDNQSLVMTYESQNLIAGAVAGGQSRINPKIIDLTDGNGNGFLVASKNLFLSALGVGATNAINGSVIILYRYTEISIAEYVGIVAGQQ